jgi:hypothetical protein
MRKLILVMIIGLIILCGCSSGRTDTHNDSDDLSYELFYVEGMPCMKFNHTEFPSYQAVDGITCDWSKWSGKDK